MAASTAILPFCNFHRALNFQCRNHTSHACLPILKMYLATFSPTLWCLISVPADPHLPLPCCSGAAVVCTCLCGISIECRLERDAAVSFGWGFAVPLPHHLLGLLADLNNISLQNVHLVDEGADGHKQLHNFPITHLFACWPAVHLEIRTDDQS